MKGTINEVKGNVSISHVDFSYDKNHRLIEDFNLEVDPGMRIAIVGPTGCGKTTFINLLMRFYDVDQGNIKIDGKSIDGLSRHALRSSCMERATGDWIKDGTVRENIAFENQMPQMKTLSVRQKKHIAGIYLSVFSAGIDTRLHEDSISHGQKQFLCITRVMLCLLHVDTDEASKVLIQEQSSRFRKHLTN